MFQSTPKLNDKKAKSLNWVNTWITRPMCFAHVLTFLSRTSSRSVTRYKRLMKHDRQNEKLFPPVSKTSTSDKSNTRNGCYVWQRSPLVSGELSNLNIVASFPIHGVHRAHFFPDKVHHFYCIVEQVEQFHINLHSTLCVIN